MRFTLCCFISVSMFLAPGLTFADSISSPNITMNVDTNRSGGAGAGGVSVTVNAITIAETMLPEYSAGSGKSITLQVRPGYQFDSSSNISAVSAHLGINGTAPNTAALLTPNGSANEVLTFNLTSADASSNSSQDIIRVTGIKLRIINSTGASGPAQTTMNCTTSAAGGAFTNQGIVAATIQRGAVDHLDFGVQPSNTAAGDDLLPVVKVVDFGGNVVLNDSRVVTLAIQTNPGSATLIGNTTNTTASGIAAWNAADHLHVNTAASGYVLRASHSGSAFLTSDVVDSLAFDITAGAPGGLIFSTQPVDTVAGDNIVVEVSVLDNFGNLDTSSNAAVSLDALFNPGKWPLLTSTSLTKNAVNGVATWDASDELHITKAVEDYTLSASGVGAPIESDPFDIVPGSAKLARFVQGPSNVRAGAKMSPPVTAEIVDEFGNRIDTDTSMTLALLSAPCGGSISGTTAATQAGIATFSNLVLKKACDDDVLAAAVSGLVAASSDTFNVTPSNAVPIGIDLLDLHPGQKARFNARGSFELPSSNRDKPTVRGATLTFSGDTASVSFTLAKKGWMALKSRGAGGRGFQFVGRRVKGSKCSRVIVKSNSIAATCSLAQGAFTLPEPGPVDIELKLGSGTARFCGHCGGTPTGDDAQSYTRLDCEALTACP